MKTNAAEANKLTILIFYLFGNMTCVKSSTTTDPMKPSHHPLIPHSTSTSMTTTAMTSTTTTPRKCNQRDVICLVGGDGPTISGNVMIGGRPVCDDSWGMEDANVVCKELGYYRAKQFTRESYYGAIDDEYRMDDVKCEGTEERLLDCDHSDDDDCSPGEAAGVICDTRDYSNILNATCFELDVSYQYGSSIDQINSIETPEACQQLCIDHQDCLFFTFYPDLKR